MEQNIDHVASVLAFFKSSMMRPLHISTLLTHKPSRILSYLNELPDKFTGKEYTFLFALSANFEHPHELQQVVGAMRNLRSDKGKGKARMVGCLSGPVSGMDLPDGNRAGLACAVAVFDARHCVPFYSALQGRNQAQVGRWHSFRKKTSDDEESLDMLNARSGQSVNWEKVWNNRTSSLSNKDMLPRELRSISPSKIHVLLYMTVPHPDLFTFALSDFLSSSTSGSSSLGLVASPTHFITGRDVTLFSDDKIYGDGTVGLALVKSEGEKEESLPQVKTEFIGLQKLGERMIVTSVEGNMVNSLDGSNPTQLLLRAIEHAEISSDHSAPTFRDEQFALAVLSPAGNILQTFKITAGDPTSRGGSISLDAAEAPTQGSITQFLRRPPNTSLKIPTCLLSSAKSLITYLTVPDLTNEQFSGMTSESQSLILPNVFLATSASGFMHSEFSRDPTCSSVEPSRSTNTIIREDRWWCSLSGGMASVTHH